MSNHIQNEQLIRRYYQAMLEGDLEGVWACYAPHVVYEDAALGHRFEGLEQTQAFYVNYMMALNVKIELTALLTTATGYAAEFIMRGTHTQDLPNMPATGKSFAVRGCNVGHIQDGQITRNTDYWNALELMSQLGLLG